MTLDEAIARLGATPLRIRELISSLGDEQLSRKTGDEFSIRETVAHLRDIDIDGYEQRVARILDEDDPLLPDVDGAKLAVERDYAHQPLAPALEAFAASRERSMARLRAAAEADLTRTATFKGVGSVTLGRLLDMWLEHDYGHLDDVRALASRA